MPENNYLVRSPLLNPQQRVLGHKLAWQKKTGVTGASVPVKLLSGLQDDSWPSILFLQGNPLFLNASERLAMAPNNMVWVLDHEVLTDADYPALAALRDEGFGLALRGVNPAYVQANQALLCMMTHLEAHPDVVKLTEILELVKQHYPAISVVALQSDQWTDFEACASLGIPVFFEALCRSPQATSTSGMLTSQAKLILQLMQMVQENADVWHLEKLLKSDAILSYKLFRYINSASFGIEVEIQSLRHAVTMLGYTPLCAGFHSYWLWPVTWDFPQPCCKPP